MSHTPNELADEFPQEIVRIHELKQSNARFAKLFDEYHEVNRSVHRAETDVEPTDDLHLVEMRKIRLSLKDEIWGMISAKE